MERRLRLFVIFMIIFTAGGCSKDPQPISYGSDGCYFCKMTIVDKIHGAELITNKGKVFKFDATECMVNYMKDIDTSEVSLYLTNHYELPEDLINSEEAIFLISKELPSPMGAYITAFENSDIAKEIQKQKGGELFTWKQLILYLDQK